MTALDAPPGPAATSPARWRPNRWTVIVAAALVLSVGITVWAQRNRVAYPDDLDPANPGSNGAQAVARVLAQQGIDVRVVRSADALDAVAPGADSTVVVTSTGQLVASTLERLRRAAAGALVVLVDPGRHVVGHLDPTQTPQPAAGEALPAGCRGRTGVPLDGLRLTVDDALLYRGRGCFGRGDRSVLVRDAGVLLFGGGEALSNDQVLRSDDAAIALRLLGQRPHLVWYVPTAADARPGERADASLVPRWVEPTLVLLAIVVLALMLWRGRRLGPLTTEPLPAVVRAAETAYSRGRLYRRTGDRAHAAAVLRRSAQRSVLRSLRLDRSLGEAEIAAAVAERLGRSPAYVADILTTHGHTPTTDKELIGLARELDRLKNEVRR